MQRWRRCVWKILVEDAKLRRTSMELGSIIRIEGGAPQLGSLVCPLAAAIAVLTLDLWKAWSTGCSQAGSCITCAGIAEHPWMEAKRIPASSSSGRVAALPLLPPPCCPAMAATMLPYQATMLQTYKNSCSH